MKEFHWKIHVELAQTYDRLGHDQKTKDYLKSSILECPDSIKWKLWLVASRIMVNQGRMDEARLCIERACVEVPPKQVSMALLEYAKYFEIISEPDRAVEIMKQTRNKFKTEWKIQFEAVMLHMRCGLFSEAENMVISSLKMHQATGRLWAVLI